MLLVTIWELGEAAGPLIIAPLSEAYGRFPVYNGANVVFVIGTAIVALSTRIELLIFARFLTGMAVASNVLNPSIIGDIFPPEKRGTAMSCVFLTTLLGGAIGPVIGGGIAKYASWRVIVFIAAGIALVCELAFVFFFRETYSVVILRRRALKQEHGNVAAANELVRTLTGTEAPSTASAIWQAMTRPARVFLGSFVLQIVSCFGAIGFTFFYVMSTTLPDILMNQFNLDEAQTGLSFMAFSVGSIIGITVCNLTVDRIYIYMSKGHHGKAIPEYRLPLLIAGAFLLPIAVVLYGWVAQEKRSVALMLAMVVFFGFSLMLGVVPLMAYVVDAFGIYSASATTALLVIRCLMGTFLPLTVGPLVDRIGYGWAFTVFAGLVLLVAPIPVLLLKYGTKWREYSSYSREET